MMGMPTIYGANPFGRTCSKFGRLAETFLSAALFSIQVLTAPIHRLQKASTSNVKASFKTQLSTRSGVFIVNITLLYDRAGEAIPLL
jgi:hypothetical protein